MCPTDGDRFFEEQTETSRYKIEVYSKYLVPLAYKVLSKRYRRLWIIDAYAGAGTYLPDADGRRAEGSPSVAAKFVRQYNIENAKAGKELRLINVEADRATFARLQESLMGVGPDVTNIHGRFQDELDRILELVGADPAFFFIDPFGMEGADLQVIDRILARRSRTVTELLINFSHAGFRRMAGNLEPKGAKTPPRRPPPRPRWPGSIRSWTRSSGAGRGATRVLHLSRNSIGSPPSTKMGFAPEASSMSTACRCETAWMGPRPTGWSSQPPPSMAST
jgi:three-Cys-motif partner protein